MNRKPVYGGHVWNYQEKRESGKMRFNILGATEIPPVCTPMWSTEYIYKKMKEIYPDLLGDRSKDRQWVEFVSDTMQGKIEKISDEEFIDQAEDRFLARFLLVKMTDKKFFSPWIVWEKLPDRDYPWRRLPSFTYDNPERLDFIKDVSDKIFNFLVDIFLVSFDLALASDQTFSEDHIIKDYNAIIRSMLKSGRLSKEQVIELLEIYKMSYSQADFGCGYGYLEEYERIAKDPDIPEPIQEEAFRIVRGLIDEKMRVDEYAKVFNRIFPQRSGKMRKEFLWEQISYMLEGSASFPFDKLFLDVFDAFAEDDRKFLLAKEFLGRNGKIAIDDDHSVHEWNRVVDFLKNHPENSRGAWKKSFSDIFQERLEGVISAMDLKVFLEEERKEREDKEKERKKKGLIEAFAALRKNKMEMR